MSSIIPPGWVKARPYQQQAIERWLEADGSGILRMATGTGKTITALLAATQISDIVNNNLLIVIGAPYQHLVDQWASELREFDVDPILAYQSRREWQPRLEREILELNNGIKNICVVVTTHKTLSSDNMRKTLHRLRGHGMIIADEVHHLGADHTQNALMDLFDLRLALSATPERWYDDEGTAVLRKYFGDTVFNYGLDEAIKSNFLCEYYYIPHITELEDDEMNVYLGLSAKIGQIIASSKGKDSTELDENQSLQTLLFKRARLIGTARKKADTVVNLLNREDDPQFSLVYCGGGNTNTDGNDERHVDEVTTRINNECGLTVNRFTAREKQEEREQLLQQFESGATEVLTSIRCLDEGVDVPATKTAYLLASTSNPRQYIQRRGRILRKHESKRFAVIHDFITVPDVSGYPELLSNKEFEAERSMIRKEIKRVSMFAESARNHPDADVKNIPTTPGKLRELRRQYDLLSEQ